MNFGTAVVIQTLKTGIKKGKLLVGGFHLWEAPAKEPPMRKWLMPLAVLGLGGVGAFLLSERGKNTLRWMFETLSEAENRFLQWNDSADSELERIQTALNRIAESLDPHPQLGH
jgi:hypothetical protein